MTRKYPGRDAKGRFIKGGIAPHNAAVDRWRHAVENKPPPYQALARLKVYSRYKSGSVQYWIDPLSGKRYSDWRKRTAQNEWLTPKQMAEARRKVDPLRIKGVMDRQPREFMPMHVVARSWGTLHDMDADEALQEPEFWEDVDEYLWGYLNHDYDYDYLAEYFDVEDTDFDKYIQSE